MTPHSWRAYCVTQTPPALSLRGELRGCSRLHCRVVLKNGRLKIVAPNGQSRPVHLWLRSRSTPRGSWHQFCSVPTGAPFASVGPMGSLGCGQDPLSVPEARCSRWGYTWEAVSVRVWAVVALGPPYNTIGRFSCPYLIGRTFLQVLRGSHVSTIMQNRQMVRWGTFRCLCPRVVH